MYAVILEDAFTPAGSCCREQAQAEAQDARDERDTAAKAQAAAQEQAAELLEEKRCSCRPVSQGFEYCQRQEKIQTV